MSSLDVENEIVKKVTDRFKDKVKVTYVRSKRIRFDLSPKDIVEFARFVKDIGFDHPISVSGVDYPKDNSIDVVYHLASCTNDRYKGIVIAICVKLDRNNPVTPTLMNIYQGVEYHERETFEMLGVIFEGHRKLDRLLLPEDWADIPPLRKDFQIKGR